MIGGNASECKCGNILRSAVLESMHSTALTIGDTTVTGRDTCRHYTLWNITAITGDSGAFYVLYKGDPA